MSTRSPEIVVQDNPDDLRYELLVDGEVVGELLYRRAQNATALALVHTEVSPSLEGRGLGGRLVTGALDDIRARGMHVIAICPFVRSYLRHHPDYNDLVVPAREVSE